MIKHFVFMICENLKIWKHNRIKSIHIDPRTEIGHHVSIASGTYIYKNVKIGNYSYINKNSNVENCIIGNYCSISSNVFISPQEHNLICFSTYPRFNNTLNSAITIIGNDVLVSAGAFIKQGIKIGNGAVVGMGAVVTKDVPPYAIVVGNPAKILRYRFPIDTVDAIENTKWWDKDIQFINQDQLNKIISNICDLKQSKKVEEVKGSRKI